MLPRRKYPLESCKKQHFNANQPPFRQSANIPLTLIPLLALHPRPRAQFSKSKTRSGGRPKVCRILVGDLENWALGWGWRGRAQTRKQNTPIVKLSEKKMARGSPPTRETGKKQGFLTKNISKLLIGLCKSLSANKAEPMWLADRPQTL